MNVSANKKNVALMKNDWVIKSNKEMLGLLLRMYAENKKHTNNTVISVIPKRYLKDGIFFIKYKLPSKEMFLSLVYLKELIEEI
jgi:hypothetical protein